jgi:hypothetical protein
VTRLALLAVLAALALPATAGAAGRSCGSLTVSGTGTVTAHAGGGAACFLAAFRNCTRASYELSRFGVDTIARTSFGIVKRDGRCQVTVATSLRVVPQKPRASGSGDCTGLSRRGTDVVATGCRGAGLTGTISLTGRSA